MSAIKCNMYNIESKMNFLRIIKNLSKTNLSIEQQFNKFKELTNRSRRTFFIYKKMLKDGIDNLTFIKKKYEKFLLQEEPNVIQKEGYNIKAFQCYFCKSQEFLNVHHKDENRENNELSNLIVLCRSCHNKIHNLMQNGVKL